MFAAYGQVEVQGYGPATKARIVGCGSDSATDSAGRFAISGRVKAGGYLGCTIQVRLKHPAKKYERGASLGSINPAPAGDSEGEPGLRIGLVFLERGLQIALRVGPLSFTRLTGLIGQLHRTHASNPATLTSPSSCYSNAMLGSCPAIAFTLTTDPARAKSFYTNVLGLEFVNQDDFAIVFNAHGTMLRVSMAPTHTPAEHPVLGWQVPDIAATVTSLGQAGVTFERYPFLPQDDLGIWTSPDGSAKVAFFKDPDGNVLSLTEA